MEKLRSLRARVLGKNTCGSYDLTLYTEDSESGAAVIEPKINFQTGYPIGLLQPECLLTGEAGSSYPYLHSLGRYREWNSDLLNRKPVEEDIKNEEVQ